MNFIFHLPKLEYHSKAIHYWEIQRRSVTINNLYDVSAKKALQVSATIAEFQFFTVLMASANNLKAATAEFMDDTWYGNDK